MMKKKITAVIVFMLMTIMMVVPVFAYEERVFDESGLFTEDEITQINEEIDYIRNTYACDVVVVTTDDSEGKSAVEYADDYFDYNGFGMGEELDGIILTVNMDLREYWMSTHGQAILWFSDNEIEGMKSTVQSYLSDSDYGNGVLAWLGDVEYELETDDGSGYIIEETSDNPFELALGVLPMAALIALIIAIIVIIVLICKCRTAVAPALANDYLEKETVKIRQSEDRFLRSHTTSVKIQTESSSGGGSSSHSSSSGSSHGGGGGSF